MAAWVKEYSTIMCAPVRLEIGSILNFPYSNEVAAGEPSEWKKVHQKYHSQNCTVVGIHLQPMLAVLKVRFKDGFETTAVPNAFTYVGPPRKKKAKKKPGYKMFGKMKRIKKKKKTKKPR